MPSSAARPRGSPSSSPLIAAGLGWAQWRRPNRILPGFGLAWALYELSAFAVSAAVGAPLGAAGLPAWGAVVAAAVMLVCLILHVGGLRGSAALARLATAPLASKR